MLDQPASPETTSNPLSMMQGQSQSPKRREELDQIYSRCYDKLTRLAESIARRSSGSQVTPSSLVHEMFLKLASSPNPAPPSERELQTLSARAMRNILRDAFRRRGAEKRGGDAPHIRFDDSLQVRSQTQFEALDEALEKLARFSPRQASVVELRYFGGLEVEEIAGLLELSERTIERDLRNARAWLAVAIERESRA
jgi:RNA polymerase sigma factor (TIGR02999 family)